MSVISSLLLIVYDPEARAKHLETLIANADKNVHDFTSAVVNSVGDVKVRRIG